MYSFEQRKTYHKVATAPDTAQHSAARAPYGSTSAAARRRAAQLLSSGRQVCTLLVFKPLHLS